MFQMSLPKHVGNTCKKISNELTEQQRYMSDYDVFKDVLYARTKWQWNRVWNTVFMSMHVSMIEHTGCPIKKR